VAGEPGSVVCGHRADEWAERHHRNRRRLFRHARPPRIDRAAEGFSCPRGSAGGDDRAERNARVRPAVRSPRYPLDRRPAGIRGPALVSPAPERRPSAERRRKLAGPCACTRANFGASCRGVTARCCAGPGARRSRSRRATVARGARSGAPDRARGSGGA
jgi:hypothetical protein